MKRNIFFFDIDGTLCHENRVSPRVKSAIQNIRKMGHLCFIATGRPPTFLQSAVKEIGFDGYIFANGAYAIENDHVIHEVKMNDEYFKPLLNYLKEHHCEYILQSKNANYINKDFHRLYDFYSRIGIPVQNFIFDFDEDEVLYDVIKLEIWPNTKEFGDVLRNEFKHYTWHQYVESNMEIYLNGISKAWGIQKVVEYYGIDFENTYCFGDGTNDIEMLNAVSNSYAMGNASDEVKAEAKFVCPSIEEDGIAVVLESLL